jgi:hypothetical protein
MRGSSTNIRQKCHSRPNVCHSGAIAGIQSRFVPVPYSRTFPCHPGAASGPRAVPRGSCPRAVPRGIHSSQVIANFFTTIADYPLPMKIVIPDSGLRRWRAIEEGFSKSNLCCLSSRVETRASGCSPRFLSSRLEGIQNKEVGVFRVAPGLSFRRDSRNPESIWYCSLFSSTYFPLSSRPASRVLSSSGSSRASGCSPRFLSSSGSSRDPLLCLCRAQRTNIKVNLAFVFSRLKLTERGPQF